VKILMVLEATFPPDIRVEKEARALVKAGHEVFVLCLGSDEMQSEELINGVRVIRRRAPEASLRRLLNYLYFALFFIHPFWERTISDAVRRYRIGAIHVHDLPLVRTGLIVARAFNTPLVADLHENYVEEMRVGMKEGGWRERIIRALIPLWRWEKLERFCLREADKVLTVVDESKNHFVQKYLIQPGRVAVVMNVEDLEVFDNIEIDEGIYDAYKNRFVISYVGGFGQHRGLETALRAMPKVLEQIPDAILLLVGKGSKIYMDSLEKLSKELNIEKNVVFTGWVDFKYVPSYLAASSVCLVPHSASGHTDTTIPHKLFQYMAMKKPVIATNVKPIKRILEETRSGMAIHSGDYNKMAQFIIKLHHDKQYARKLGINGRRAVETKYNWKNEAKKLAQIYNELERNHE
jgi:glycosyltransferase involved in cell wall biosynthesis